MPPTARFPALLPGRGTLQRWAAAAALVCLAAILAGPARAGATPDAAIDLLLRSRKPFNMRGRQVTWSVATGGVSRPYVQTVARRSDGRSLAVCTEPSDRRGAYTLEDGATRSTWDPRQRRLAVTRAMPRPQGAHALQRAKRLIRANYKTTVEGAETVAGRRCLRVAFVPRTLLAYTVRVWIDTATGVVLGHQESNSRTDTLSLTFFMSVEYPRSIPVSEVTRKPPAGAAIARNSLSPLLTSVSALSERAGFPVTVPLTMPGGYLFEHGEVISAVGKPAVCLRYTDGISHITIFQSRAPVRRSPSHRVTAHVRMGITDASTVTYACGSMDYVVMGHGEAVGLAAVAHALDPRQEQAMLADLVRRYPSQAAAIRRARDSGIGAETLRAMAVASRRGLGSVSVLARRYADGWDLPKLLRQASH